MLMNIHTKACQTRARAPSEQADLIWCDFYWLLLVFPVVSCLIFIMLAMKFSQALRLIDGVIVHVLCTQCSNRWEHYI